MFTFRRISIQWLTRALAALTLVLPATGRAEPIHYPSAIYCQGKPCLKGLPSCTSEARGNQFSITVLDTRHPSLTYDALPEQKALKGKLSDGLMGIELPMVKLEFGEDKSRLSFKRKDFEAFADGRSATVSGSYQRDLEEFHHSALLEVECTKELPLPSAVPAHQPLEAIVSSCAACHGSDGKSVLPGVPNIGGLRQDQLAAMMRDYRIGARNDAAMSAMGPLAQSLNDEDTLSIAAYYASQPQPAQAGSPGPVAPIASLKSCCGCHSAGGILAPGRGGGVYLTSQSRDYLKAQLDQFNNGVRSDLRMRYIIRQYTGEEIGHFADYFAASTPEHVCSDLPAQNK